jgi:YYY domain-containing protein
MVVGWVAFPIAYRLLPNLPSKGYALAKPLGLLLWGFIYWILNSLGVLQNDIGGAILALIFVLAASTTIFFRGGGKEIWAWIKAHKSNLISMEAVFLVFFAVWAVVRAANPEVAYTEKPMELAFINAILKSPVFPPNDPWLSGYAISYYYFGYVIISLLIRVSGVVSSIGFNLASALWFGLTAMALYGVVFDLLIARRKHEDEKTNIQHARWGAILGPIFVLLISCLEGVFEFLYSRGVFWKADASGTLSSKFWNWLDITELNVAPSLPLSWIPNRSGGWMWWRGSRVIQDLSLTGNKIEVIQEFPFFSYLLSDLHPHVLAMPFGLLAIGMCLNLFLSQGGFFLLEVRVREWLKRWQFWLTAVVFGSLAFINTWDFPIYVGLFSLILTVFRVKTLGWTWRRVWEFALYGLTLGAAGMLLHLPFFLGFASQAGGILPSMEYMTRGVHFWIVFGALLIPILIWLINQTRQKESQTRLLTGFKFGAILFGILLVASLAFGWLIFSFNSIGFSLAASQNGVIALLGTKLMTAGQAFSGLHGYDGFATVFSEPFIRRLKSPGTWITLLVMVSLVWALVAGKIRKPTAISSASSGDAVQIKPDLDVNIFVYLLILVGLALSVFPEFFYLRDQFGTRMNTIFKFYFQAWIFWGIAAAFASADLFSKLKGWRLWLFNAVWIISLLAGLAYPGIMIFKKTNNFNPAAWTLDGNAYISIYNPDDYAAIQWLKDQPSGILVEAVGGSYTDYARVSTRTGFPTVLGWPGHEGQWRGGYEEVGSREGDIRLIYETDDWVQAANLIDLYNVRYIYIGGLESNLYKVDTSKFESMLPLVYQNDGVRIFEAAGQIGEGLQ